jgi:hypothetical protein
MHISENLSPLHMSAIVLLKSLLPYTLESSCHIQPYLYLTTSLFDVHSLQESYLTERGLNFFSPHPAESGDILIWFLGCSYIIT